VQGHRAIGGNVLEIGVHHGRYFILLANGLKEDEVAVAVDIFERQDLNVSLSGRGSWPALIENLGRFAPLAHVEIVPADSTTLDDAFVSRYRGMRFVSIDGGHHRAVVCSDLWLAERVLCRSGIVALDDIYRQDWSGVTAGLSRYLGQGGGLVPFALIPNKLLMTTDRAHADSYKAALREEFPNYSDVHRHGVEVFEYDDVLLVWEKPQK
jgi:hypothetical protein